MGLLVSVLFNVPLEQDNPWELRKRLVKDLINKFGQDISIVHGECTCPYGAVGSENRIEVTAFIPNFKGILTTLSRLEWGQQEEIRIV